MVILVVNFKVELNYKELLGILKFFKVVEFMR
jgi:hypothetical protein